MNGSFKNKFLTGLVILLLAANVTTIVFFWMGMRKMHPVADMQQPSEYLVKKLSFTDAQQEQYKSMVKQHRERTKELRENMRAAKDSFFDLLSHEDIDEGMKNNLLDRIGSVNRELDLMTLNHFRDVRKICTPDQQTKFDKIIKDVLRMMSGPPKGDRPPPHGEHEDRPEGPPQGE